MVAIHTPCAALHAAAAEAVVEKNDVNQAIHPTGPAAAAPNVTVPNVRPAAE